MGSRPCFVLLLIAKGRVHRGRSTRTRPSGPSDRLVEGESKLPNQPLERFRDPLPDQPTCGALLLIRTTPKTSQNTITARSRNRLRNSTWHGDWNQAGVWMPVGWADFEWLRSVQVFKTSVWRPNQDQLVLLVWVGAWAKSSKQYQKDICRNQNLKNDSQTTLTLRKHGLESNPTGPLAYWCDTPTP